MSEPITLYKLIVLYMLHKVDFPLTTSQISSFILDRDYTSFFTLQSVLSELSETGMIRLERSATLLIIRSRIPGRMPCTTFRDVSLQTSGKISTAICRKIKFSCATKCQSSPTITATPPMNFLYTVS